MRELQQRVDRSGGRALVFIVMFLIMVIPVIGTGQYDGIQSGIEPREIVLGNHTEINSTIPDKFPAAPDPVTVIHVEVSETSLPGPRYMAFGPSVIDISTSPAIIGGIVVLVFIGIAAWCIRTCIPEDEDKEQ